MKNLVQVKTENGNIITTRGRFDLYEVDANGIPTKPFESFRQPGMKKVNELKKVEVPKAVEPDISLNFFEKIKAKYYHIKEGAKETMFDAIKKFLTKKIVEWIIKDGGAVVAALGFTTDNLTMIIGGIVAFIIGAIWSLITTGKLALTPPEEFQKIK